MQRVLLAYSGSPRASAALTWLREEEHAEVVALIVDVGAPAGAASIRAQALALGAVRGHVTDARDALVYDVLLPALQAGVPLASTPLVGAGALTVTAREAAAIARVEGAAMVAHADEDYDAEPGAFTRLVRTIAPELVVLVPPVEGRPVPVSRFRTVWGQVASGVADGDPGPASAGPTGEAAFEIEFVDGVPVAISGVRMALVELLSSLETIAARHPAGRVVGAAPSGGSLVYDVPALVVLVRAWAALAGGAVPPAEVDPALADGLRRGTWFTPECEAAVSRVRARAAGRDGRVAVALRDGTVEARVIDAQGAPA